MSKKHFEVTRDHIKLVKRLIIEWNDRTDFRPGVPTINGKRPYGNSDVIEDIAEIINLDFYDREKGLTAQQEKYCLKLHMDMETVLQIVLSTGAFKSGEYECDEYSVEWKKVKK